MIASTRIHLFTSGYQYPRPTFDERDDGSSYDGNSESRSIGNC